VRLKVDPGENDGLKPGVVTLTATAEENGDTTSTREATVDGPGMEIIFNVKYLTDVLSVIGTDRVALELNTPQQPGVIKPGNDENGNTSDYVYVIMPMHSTR
jgi:DNA polymerase-3 subunit beta